MKIVKETSPYIRKSSSVERMMIDVLIALIPVVVFSVVMNGFLALPVILLSIVTMLLAEMVFIYLSKQDPYDGVKKTFKQKIKTAYNKATINNVTAPLISALIYAMIMPVGTSWYVVVIGALAGIVIGKLLFGGLGANIFNPAAVGRVVVMICFGKALSDSNGYDAIVGGTPLAQLSENLANITSYSLKELFLGVKDGFALPGSMGEVSALAILVGGAYLFIRRSADYRPMIAMILSFMALMFLAGFMVDGVDAFRFCLYQTFAGGLIFGAVFMVTDPVTSPTTKNGRIFYGIIVGVVACLIRLFGAYPEGVAFAILIGNMIVPVLDYYKFSSTKLNYKQIIAWSLVMIIAAVVIILAL